MEALLYDKVEGTVVRCNLCNHRCVIKEGKRGICNVRENRSGTLETLVYDKVIAVHVDPIEKKPLFHFHPGTLSFSLGTVGCNFRCKFCQNADIAQMAINHDGRIEGRSYSPRQLVDAAVRENCISIAYTYTEPTIFFELAFETARLAHDQGIKNVFVTNGYMTPEALEMVGPYLDAANVDLKAFNDNFYKTLCSARIEPVKETLRLMKRRGVFVEVTTLLIPGLNDDPAELSALAAFIADDLGDDTPWHVSRFHPTYRLTDRGATPVATLNRAWEIGIAAGLKYVYTGNVPGQANESTYCHQCKTPLITRRGFYVAENRIKDNRCPECGATIHGVGISD